MKTTYETIIALLKSIPDLAWVDLDCGQIDNPALNERYPVAFPCALVDLAITSTAPVTTGRQMCNATITVRLAFDAYGVTAADVPDNWRLDALAFFDILGKVFNTLQSYTDGHLGEMERLQLRPERRSDGLKVYSIPFSTSFIEEVE